MSSFSRAVIEFPVITKLWSKFPKSWKYILNTGLLLKYKTMNLEKLPTSIKLPSSFELHINPNENRGRALLIRNGVTQASLVRFWERFVLEFSPTIVLDIGVNYGECLFSVKYPENTKIFGVEANEGLIKYINQSLARHPNESQITIFNAFASNKIDQTQEFFIDKNWSGTSSGKEIYSQMVEKHLVQTITIDSLLKNINLSQERILFKIDVEGFEGFVLEGMQQVIKESKSLLGIIEFDSVYIQNSGTDLNAFLTILSVNFDVYLIDKQGEMHLQTDVSITGFQKVLKAKAIHTDLVISKKK